MSRIGTNARYVTVESAGATKELGIVSETFNWMMILANKSATETNTGNITIEFRESGIRSARELYPGNVMVLVTPKFAVVDLTQIGINVATAGDGAYIQWTTPSWDYYLSVPHKLERAAAQLVQGRLLGMGGDISVNLGQDTSEELHDSVYCMASGGPEPQPQTGAFELTLEIGVMTNWDIQGDNDVDRKVVHETRCGYVFDAFFQFQGRLSLLPRTLSAMEPNFHCAEPLIAPAEWAEHGVNNEERRFVDIVRIPQLRCYGRDHIPYQWGIGDMEIGSTFIVS